MESFQSVADRKQIKAFGSSYPYASVYILAHAEEAERQQIEQAEFLQRLLEEPETWGKPRLFRNASEADPGSMYARGVSLLHMFAFHGYTRLTKALLDNKFNINAQGGSIAMHSRQLYLVEDNKETAELLLKEGAPANAKGILVMHSGSPRALAL